MTKKKPKVQVKLYMHTEAHELLRAHADAEQISMSQLAEELVYGLGPVKQTGAQKSAGQTL